MKIVLFAVLFFAPVVFSAKLGKNDCECMNLGFCPHAQVDNNVDCPNRSQVCCLPETALDNPGTLDDRIGLGQEKPLPNLGSCICMPSVSCIDLRKGNFSVRTRSIPCANPQNICCSLQISDEDILTGIFGTENITIEPISPGCVCVPHHECKDQESGSDLRDIVSVRSGAGCNDGSLTCCEPANVLAVDPLPIGPDPVVPEACRCVPQESCIEQEQDISSLVHIRSSFGVCSKSGDICCPEIDILPVKPAVSSVIEDKPPIGVSGLPLVDCTCVPKSACTQTVASGGLPCALQDQICCEESNLVPDIPAPEVPIPELPEVPIPEPSVPKEKCSCVHQSGCDDIDVTLEQCGGVDEVCCLKPRMSCGQSHMSNLRIDVRIRGGFQAKFAEFPWMVALFQEETNGFNNYTCGGSLIHPRVVLTTAHCVEGDTGLLKARAGDWDINSVMESHPYEERYIAQKVLHPRYSSRTLANDIALLVLASPLPMDYHINTICLPDNDLPVSKACMASGWGKDKFGPGGRLQSTLKKINVPHVDNLSCQTSLRSTILGPKFKLNPTFTCAGGVRDDACSGDGGSPLVCKLEDGSNRFVQMGAVAWGIECGNVDVPGVYASTVTAMPWIRQFMTREFGSSSFKYFT